MREILSPTKEKKEQHISDIYLMFITEVIEDFDIVEIDPETLCQYTGLNDKNGKRIWENDILHNGNKMIVKWNEPCGRWDLYIVNVSHIPMGAWRPLVIDWRTSDWKEYSDCHECEVIDNIFDNPELLGGADLGYSIKTS
ncbi:YopX family protein [Sellimonas intestinalis]|uniref:YopX family protein n=1 Tax=Sellimonas intestinalis TaxID=1653434 RepID=UPI0039915967